MLQIFLKFSCELPGATTRFVSSVIHELNARDPSRVSSKDLCVLLQSLVILGKHCSHTSSHASMLSVLEGFKFQDFWRFLERCRCLCLSVSGKYFTCGPWHVSCCRVFMLKGFGDQTLSLPRRGKEAHVQRCSSWNEHETKIDKLKLKIKTAMPILLLFHLHHLTAGPFLPRACEGGVGGRHRWRLRSLRCGTRRSW